MESSNVNETEARRTEENGSAPVRLRVRRAPNIPAFLVTGAVLGFLAGVLLDVFGASPQETGGAIAASAARYTPDSALAFLAVIGAFLGMLLAGLVVIVLDRRS